MNLASIVLIAGLLALIIVGLPISWALLLSSVAAIMIDGNIPLTVIAQRMFGGADSFPLLAVPAFMLAGDIMCKGQISDRLVDLAKALVGRISGALSLVTIVTCTMFAALSGSSIATAAAVGGLMCPAMEKEGYPKDYAAALTAIGGTLGPVIPPSILFIFYANATGVSAVKLLMSGVVPGILACCALCAVAWVIAKVKHYPREAEFSFRNLAHAFVRAIPALMMPVIILGGIYLGVFTATEAAIVAVVYGVFATTVIMKTVKVRELPGLFKDSVKAMSNVMLLVIASNVFAWLIAYFNVSTAVASWVTAVTSSKYTFLMLAVLILLIAGMFLDAMPITLIMAPILHPVAVAYGIDPIHFGLVCGFVLTLGSATPPFGPALFTACGITRMPITSVSKKLVPFLICEVCMSLLFAFVPVFSTWLPNIMY